MPNDTKEFWDQLHASMCREVRLHQWGGALMVLVGVLVVAATPLAWVHLGGGVGVAVTVLVGTSIALGSFMTLARKYRSTVESLVEAMRQAAEAQATVSDLRTQLDEDPDGDAAWGQAVFGGEQT